MVILRRATTMVLVSAILFSPARALAADGYWLDQYSALLFMGLLRLDPELREMRQKGAEVVMVHADSLPDPLLHWIAWRAQQAGLKPVAWIQRPTAANLSRLGIVPGYKALQVDDHFFAAPTVSIAELRAQLGTRELWCSFQPRQYSWNAASLCDHVDIQLYRNSCDATVDAAYRLGVTGRNHTAIAVYHDGSEGDERALNCFRNAFRETGNRLFVFKWKNPEHWLTPYTRVLWQTLSRFRGAASVRHS